MIENPPGTLFFDEEEHKYTDKHGNVLISVSQLIEKFVYPFDEDGMILKRCAAKRGVSEEELAAEWKKINEEACSYGSCVHQLIEDYVNKKPIDPNHEYYSFLEQFKKIKFKGHLQSEVKLFNSKDKIAGTCDIIDWVDEDTVDIYDVKTNRRLDKYSPFGNRFKYPLNDWYSCNYFHYTLQLNIYSYLIEGYGFFTRNMNLIYFNPETQKMELHKIKPAKRKVKKMIDYYKTSMLDSSDGEIWNPFEL